MPVDCTFSTPEGVFNYRVGAVIRRGGTLLAMKEEGLSHWYLPGGRVRLREPAEQALAREIGEELSLPCRVERPLWLCENFFPLNGRQVHELCLYFLVELEHSALPPGENFLLPDSDGELHQYHWFTEEELRQAVLYPSFLKEEWPSLPQGLELRSIRD